MVNALLHHKANVFAQDQDGALPIHRAVLLGHASVVEAIITAMESEQCQTKYAMTGELAAAALELPFEDGKALPHGLVERVVAWGAAHIPENTSLLHLWAISDRAQAYSAACEIGLHDALGALDKTDEDRATPMDRALQARSSAIVHHLLKAGCAPTKLYFIEDCGFKLHGMLNELLPSDAFARSRKLLETIAFEAAQAGDLATLQAHQLNRWNFLTSVDLDGKTCIQYAIEKGHANTWPCLGIKESAKNNGAWAMVMLSGRVGAWGSVEHGGDASEVQAQLVEVQSISSTDATFAVHKFDGSVVAWGDMDRGGDCSKIQGQLAGDIQQIYATDQAFFATKADGSVVAWGSVDWSDEKLQEYGVVKSVIKNGKAFAATKSDGSVVAWGDADAQTKLDGVVKSVIKNGNATAAVKQWHGATTLLAEIAVRSKPNSAEMFNTCTPPTPPLQH